MRRIFIIILSVITTVVSFATLSSTVLAATTSKTQVISQISSIKKLADYLSTPTSLVNVSVGSIPQAERVLLLSTVRQEIDSSSMDITLYASSSWRTGKTQAFYVRIETEQTDWSNPAEPISSTRTAYYGPFRGNIVQLLNEVKKYRQNDHLTGSKTGHTSGDIVLTENPLVATR